MPASYTHQKLYSFNLSTLVLSSHLVVTSCYFFFFTWHIRWVLKLVAGTAIQRTVHKIWWLIHVLGGGEKRRCVHVLFLFQCFTRNKRKFGELSIQQAGESSSWKQHQVLSRETHNPHAIKGYLVMEILHHVMPPVMSLWISEVREGSRARPNLEESA